MPFVKLVKISPQQRVKVATIAVGSTLVLATFILLVEWNLQKRAILADTDTSLLSVEKLEFALIGSIAICLVIVTILYVLSVFKTKSLILQERINAQATKDELISIASHQLRTPATAVKQYLGMILQGYTGDVTPEQYKLLKKAYDSNERQIETVNQMLYITRADAGRLKLQKSNFNLNELVRESIFDLSETVKERHQKIKFLPSHKSINVYADKHFIRMVIENLITNASKYTHEKGKITIETSRNNNMVVLSVEDTGVGINSEDRAKLFKKFSRIDNELSVQAGGSGIGLFLGKMLVEMHGGKITVDSKPKKGTTFNVVLPITKEAVSAMR